MKILTVCICENTNSRVWTISEFLLHLSPKQNRLLLNLTSCFCFALPNMSFHRHLTALKQDTLLVKQLDCSFKHEKYSNVLLSLQIFILKAEYKDYSPQQQFVFINKGTSVKNITVFSDINKYCLILCND